MSRDEPKKRIELDVELIADLDVGDEAMVGLRGGLSRLDCQSKLAFTNTCINCSGSTIF